MKIMKRVYKLCCCFSDAFCAGLGEEAKNFTPFTEVQNLCTNSSYRRILCDTPPGKPRWKGQPGRTKLGSMKGKVLAARQEPSTSWIQRKLCIGLVGLSIWASRRRHRHRNSSITGICTKVLDFSKGGEILASSPQAGANASEKQPASL